MIPVVTSDTAGARMRHGGACASGSSSHSNSSHNNSHGSACYSSASHRSGDSGRRTTALPVSSASGGVDGSGDSCCLHVADATSTACVDGGDASACYSTSMCCSNNSNNNNNNNNNGSSHDGSDDSAATTTASLVSSWLGKARRALTHGLAAARARTTLSCTILPLRATTVGARRATSTRCATAAMTRSRSWSPQWTTVSASASASALPLRDRVATLYAVVFTRRFSLGVLLTSLLLVAASVLRPSVVLCAWYDVCEAILTLLFVAEVLLRFVVMRSRFCESMINVVEAVLCAVCVVLFSILHVNHLLNATTLKEHQLLLLLRVLSQCVRVLGVLAHELLTRHASSGLRSLHAFTVGMDVLLPPPSSSSSSTHTYHHHV